MSNYFIQGMYQPEGYIVEEITNTDEKRAIILAKAMLSHPTFAGDYVRVITGDGELLFEAMVKHIS